MEIVQDFKSSLQLKRLLELNEPLMFWNSGAGVTVQDIENAIKNSIPEQIKPYGHKYDQTEEVTLQSDEWHLGRVIYFINHPDEIKDIEIGEYTDFCNSPYIVDGNHRYMAAVYLQMDKIPCSFTGELSVLLFLMGAINECYLLK